MAAGIGEGVGAASNTMDTADKSYAWYTKCPPELHEMAEIAKRVDTDIVAERIQQHTAYLTIVVPDGRHKDMRRILKPFYKSLECLDAHLRVQEAGTMAPLMGGPPHCGVVPHYSVCGDEMSSPSLAVILFLPELGPVSAGSVRPKFHKLPWRHHHTIQLQRAGSENVLGKHEFHFLSRQLPLWSVGVSPNHVSYVRFNLFVRRFNAMVEFYRLITGTEMESRKPGFSLFSIGNFRRCESSATHQSVCELVLKYCPQVSPYPLKDAFLTFPVRNLRSLLAVLPSRPQLVSPNTYLVHDPDGNSLLLYEASPPDQLPPIFATSSAVPRASIQGQTQTADKASVHSDSIDSGRYSDFEAGSCELDHCMSRLAAVCRLDDDISSANAHLTLAEHPLPSAGHMPSTVHRQKKCGAQKPKICPAAHRLGPGASQLHTKPVSDDRIDPSHRHETRWSDYASRPCDAPRQTSSHKSSKVNDTAETRYPADDSISPRTLEDDLAVVEFLQSADDPCVPRSKFIADLRDFGYLNPVQTSAKTNEAESIQKIYDATFL
ncbi:hypothetical protein Btru_033821 [Bulinus truncatus]|nr:hypothetical protein Btru_033821 [Bulinus truncatus]